MSIGANIKRLRLQNHMEQKDLAALLFVSNRTISSWECDRTEPKMGMITQMSQIFGCKKTDLLDTPEYIEACNNDNIEKYHEVSDDQIIAAYRTAPYEMQRAVNKLLDLED